MSNYQDLEQWARKSQSAPRMDVIARHAAPYLEISVDDLDQHAFKLNVQNGTLNVAQSGGKWRVDLRPHYPEDYITKICEVSFDPDATCPTYDEALALVQPDPAIRAFIHRAVGYACTGDVSEQKVFFFYGGGRNGKSTFMEAWANLLGDYATTIPIERFLSVGQAGDAAKPSPDLARLRAVRMLRTSEPEQGAKLAESVIKLTTSGEPMLVRELNRPFFQLRPQFKLFISGNYKPVIRGTDDGIWRRLILIPWKIKIADEQCDPHLIDKLSKERSGILNRLIAGMIDWLDNGLNVPTEISDATAEYRRSSDHLGRFLSECVLSSPGKRVAASELYAVYTAWAFDAGAPVWKPTGFGRAMTDRGYRTKKSSNHYWVDIELAKTPADFDAATDNSDSQDDFDPDDIAI